MKKKHSELYSEVGKPFKIDVYEFTRDDYETHSEFIDSIKAQFDEGVEIALVGIDKAEVKIITDIKDSFVKKIKENKWGY